MIKRVTALIFLISCILFLYPVSVYADMGPKPSLTIYCKNMPDTTCYLDLLVDRVPNEGGYKNINNTQNYNPQMIKILEDYNVDGWLSAMLHGTGAPIFGDIVCNIKDGKCTQKFGYLGIPDRFKIIVVTADNKTVISNEINRLAFNSTVYFDYQKAQAAEKNPFSSSILQFLGTMIFTLIIEGIVLLVFRFKLALNWKPFLIINLITQILLNTVVIYQMATNGTFFAFFYYVLFEMIIFTTETVLFSKFLKQHSIIRRVLFALTANLLSFITGIAVMMWF